MLANSVFKISKANFHDSFLISVILRSKISHKNHIIRYLTNSDYRYDFNPTTNSDSDPFEKIMFLCFN